MVPESTLEELEAACVAAQHCLTRLVIVKTTIDSQPRDVIPSLLAEAIREPSRDLLESWRSLHAVSPPHVERDYMAACEAPVEIGSVIATSAQSAALWVSHLAIVSLSAVLMPAGFWPSEPHETDCLLADFRSEKPLDISQKAVLSLRAVIGEFSVMEIRKLLVSVVRENAKLRSQPSQTGKGDDGGDAQIPDRIAHLVSSVVSVTGKASSITRQEAEACARKLDSDITFAHLTAKEMAARIRQASGKSCSESTVKGLNYWDEAMERTGRGRQRSGAKSQGRKRGSLARPVHLSEGLEAVTATGGNRDLLEALAEAEDQVEAKRATQKQNQTIDYIQKAKCLSEKARQQTIAKLLEGEMTSQQALDMVVILKQTPCENQRRIN